MQGALQAALLCISSPFQFTIAPAVPGVPPDVCALCLPCPAPRPTPGLNAWTPLSPLCSLAVHPSALQLVADRALQRCRAESAAALPGLAAAMAAAEWPQELVAAALCAGLDEGMAGSALQLLGQLAKDGQASAAVLAAALLDHPSGEAQQLAQVGAIWGMCRQGHPASSCS